MKLIDTFSHCLTKKISLVLISSSLILHGCSHHKQEEEKQKDEAGNPVQSNGQTGGYHGGYHGGSHWWLYYYLWGGRGGYYRSGFAPQPTGAHAVGSQRSGGSAAGGAHGSNVGSARGGFGGSAHGIAGG